MKTRHRTIGTLALAAVLTISTTAASPSFETASVRPNSEAGKPGTRGTTVTVTPGGITFSEVSLLNCITEAYGVTSYQVQGPAWIRNDWFDIVARPAAPASREELMTMLQNLLADRFGLTLRREQKEFTVLALTVAKNGHRLTPTAESSEPSVGGVKWDIKWGMMFHGAPMSSLAAYLSRQGLLGYPVVDQTNLEGRFDFALDLMRLSAAGAEPIEDGKKALFERGGAAFADALNDLGLRLERRKAPLDLLVVEHADRTPREN